MVSKEELVKGFVHSGALKYGKFRLKSGKDSNYFFDASALCMPSILIWTGNALWEAVFNRKETAKMLKDYYEGKSKEEFGALDRINAICGIASKGVPIATAFALGLFHRSGGEGRLCFVREKVKAHGEGGRLFGTYNVGDNVIIVDDVMTSGGSLLEGIEECKREGLNPLFCVVVLDRQEQDVRKEIPIPVVSVLTASDLFAHIHVCDKRPN